MTEGIIIKALSGFYYVAAGGKIIDCRARGRFRLDGGSPLVGDRVRVSLDAHGKGRVDEVKERKNWFIRPAVANIDTLVFVAANTNPVTDPFLVDPSTRRTSTPVISFLRSSPKPAFPSCARAL